MELHGYMGNSCIYSSALILKALKYNATPTFKRPCLSPVDSNCLASFAGAFLSSWILKSKGCTANLDQPVRMNINLI